MNDFASAVVGHTIKGDACVVHDGLTCEETSIPQLLSQWRWKHQSRQSLSLSHKPLTTTAKSSWAIPEQQVVCTSVLFLNFS